MKVSFYILQKNDQNIIRELPFMSTLNFGNVLMEGMAVEIAQVDFVIYKIESRTSYLKAVCKMKFDHQSEHIDKTFHQFPEDLDLSL